MSAFFISSLTFKSPHHRKENHHYDDYTNSKFDTKIEVTLKKKECIKHKKSDYLIKIIASSLSDSLGVRTQDPNIKSVVLSRLLKVSPTARLLKATC